MKRFKILQPLTAAILCLAALLLNPVPASAQIPGSGKSGGMGAGFMKLFGANTNFIAKADIHVTDSGQHEITSLTMDFEMLAGQTLRMDINLEKVKSRELSPDLITAMKSMHMDQMTSIIRPDQKVVLTIYPGLNAYAQTPMPKDEIDAAAMNYKMEKTRLGKETIDGHACEKYNVVLTDDKGVKQHSIIWTAADLKDFPIQIQISEDTSTLTLKFKDIKLGRPDASRFQAPSGMAKFDSVDALMSDVATRKK